MTLGEQIQALRKSAGLSQEELGDKLGVALQSVSKWESDLTIPELDKLIAMSRLFEVSVGELLGLEEAGETDHELTERELKALEAIAQRLTPPQPEAGKRRNWPFVLAALVFVGTLMALLGRIGSLESQIGSLHYNISDIDNTVSRQINSLAGQVREILEEQDSVTAGRNYSILEMDLKAGTVTFALSATPREYREGMTAVFYASGPEFETVEVPGALNGGQTFTATLVCPLADSITLSVGFTADGVTVNQELDQVFSLWSDSLLYVNGDMMWSISGRGEEARVADLKASVWTGDPGQYKTAGGWQEVTVVRGTLRLWTGDRLAWSQEYPDLTEKEWGEDIPIPTQGLELVRGEQWFLSLLYTDTTGREEEVCIARHQVNDENILERRDPYEEGLRYPWE